MKLNFRQRLSNIKEAAFCISLGTIAGLLTYIIFLILKIDIFGWNLGLIFAPLVAGYTETILADKIIGESTGAVSAFILFLVTVIYGFIISNPTLGLNVITIGSIVIILQAAMPIFINYFIIIVIIGLISYLIGIFTKINEFFYNKFNIIYHKLLNKPITPKLKESIEFYEDIDSIDVNNLGVLFLTSTHSKDKKVTEYKGVFEGKIIFTREKSISKNFDNREKIFFNKLKIAKDQALLNLSEEVKNEGCNCVFDLTFEYNTIGFGGDDYQVVARGTGVKLLS